MKSISTGVSVLKLEKNLDLAKVRILIADDQRMISEMLGLYLAANQNAFVEYSFSLEETQQKIQKSNGFDVVLLDYLMPGMSGIESVSAVIESNKVGKVIIFSENINMINSNLAVKLGVAGLISKSMTLNSIYHIISLVLSGEKFIPALSQTDHRSTYFAEKLSEAEETVLRLASLGYTNSEISLETGESEALTKKHMRVVCRKLRARNRAHAVMLSGEFNLFRK